MDITKLSALCLTLAAGAASAHADVIFNEVMQSNVYCIMDDIKEFPDSWVELYNNGSEEVNLSGYRISVEDDFDNAYVLPYAKIPAGGFKLIYCDKADKDMHTDFRIDSGKGSIYLYTPSGEVADQLTLKKQPAPDVAYGRASDGDTKWGYQLTPTPGAANQGGISDVILSAVTFSTPGGVWETASNIRLTLELPSDAPEGAYIIYTTNGSEPTTDNAKQYTAPINFSTSTVIRAKVMCDGCISIPSNAQSYIFLERPLNIPLVSIAVNNEYLNDNSIGIFADGTGGYNNENYRQDWRRPINLELFDAEGEPSVLNQLCETRVQGGYTRSNALKSMAFYANKRFGTKRFEYEFWNKDKPGITDNKSFILRDGGNDYMWCYVRDGLMQRVIGRNTDIDWQGYAPAIVYINGQYHGMLAIRERSNEDNIAANYDGLEDIDMFENWHELKAGDWEAMDEFLDFIESEEEHTFDEWKELIDVEVYTNLMALNYWVYNTDFPHNNIVIWRPRTGDDTRWRWLVKDCDFGLGIWNSNDNINRNFTDFLYANTKEDPTGYTLFKKAMECKEFKDYFANHLIAYCGDFLNSDTFTQYCNEIVAENYGEQARSHENWKWASGAWWSDFNYNVNFMLDWINRRGNNIPSLISKSFGLGSNISVTVNNSLSADETEKLHLKYAGVPLTSGVFYGHDYINRTINIESAAGDDIVAWEVRTADGKSERVEGANLSWPIDRKSDITINAVIDHSGISDVAPDINDNILVDHLTITAKNTVSVYDMSGRLIATGKGCITLPQPGIYIIKDSKSHTTLRCAASR